MFLHKLSPPSFLGSRLKYVDGVKGAQGLFWSSLSTKTMTQACTRQNPVFNRQTLIQEPLNSPKQLSFLSGRSPRYLSLLIHHLLYAEPCLRDMLPPANKMQGRALLWSVYSKGIRIEDLEESYTKEVGRSPCHLEPTSLRGRNGGSERGDKYVLSPFTGGRGAMVIRDPWTRPSNSAKLMNQIPLIILE